MKTKVTVLKGQGADEAGNKYPAPGIPDGTHECELKWQVIELSYGKWRDVKQGEDVDNLKSLGRTTSLNWVLAEQEKEGDKPHLIWWQSISDEQSIDILKKEGIYGHDQGVNEEEVKYFYKTYNTTYLADTPTNGNDPTFTRIAELEARVAELERVLREIASYTYPYSAIIKATRIATNALKNQQLQP